MKTTCWPRFVMSSATRSPREIMPAPRRMALVKRSRTPGRHRRRSGHRQTHARSRSRLECLPVKHPPERQYRVDPSAQSNRQNPGAQTPRPQTILNQLGILSPELQKFRHYSVELFRILQVHYMPCIRGYKQL
jgi:hypothetical protein